MSQPILALFVSFLTESAAPVAPMPGNETLETALPAPLTSCRQQEPSILFSLRRLRRSTPHHAARSVPSQAVPSVTHTGFTDCRPVCHTHWLHGLPSRLSHTGFTDLLASFVSALVVRNDGLSMRSRICLLSLMF